MEAVEARALLDAINISTPAGLRNQALIGLMIYSFARVRAALAIKREDVFVQGGNYGCGYMRIGASAMKCLPSCFR